MDALLPPLRKIYRPTLPPFFLHREALVNILKDAIIGSDGTAAFYKLVLLCAPAGYGKTTLLADFVQQTDFPSCWYFFDTSDLDTALFLERLIMCIAQLFPQIRTQLEVQIDQIITIDGANKEQFEAIIHTLIKSIEDLIPDRFALIFSNYHEVNSNVYINKLVDLFLRFLPRQCTLVIESRATPELEFAPLLAHGQLFGLGSSDLRFTAQEVQALSQLQNRMLLTPEEAEKLTTSFDGWIAGILLGTRLGNIQVSLSKSSSATWAAPAIHADRQMLLTYLVVEIFAREPQIYTFLQETSILQQLTPEVCNALLDITNANELLIYVEQRGFFVTRNTSGSQLTYLLHPILRELFYDELCRRDKERVIDLHIRAAHWFYGQKDRNQAILHALAAGDNDFASAMVTEVAKKILLQNYSEQIVRWLNLLPATVVEQNPRLLLAHANCHLMRYETKRAYLLLAQVQTLLAQCPSGGQDVLLAETLISLSIASFDMGDYTQAQQYSQKALELLPVHERELCALAYQRCGISTALLGNYTTGLAQLQQALQLWGLDRQERQTANLHGYLANVYTMIGNYALAEHHRMRAIAICVLLNDAWGHINNLIWLAILKRSKGALHEAEHTLNEALTMAQDVHFTSGEAYALLNLGEIYLDQNLLDKALTATEDCLALARQIDDTYLINTALFTMSLVYLFMDDLSTASFLIEQANIQLSNVTHYEKVLYKITQGTILFFQHRYQEACSYLTELEASFTQSELKSTHLRTLIRLAACQMKLGRKQQAAHSIEKAVALLQQNHNEYIFHVELSRFPCLREAVESMPVAARLNAPLAPSLASSAGTDATLPGSLSLHEVITGNDAPALRIIAFGKPDIIINDKPVTRWRLVRSTELFFFLLNQRQPVHKEQIIDALWPTLEESNVDQTLRSIVHYLRKAIGRSCIVYQAGTYALHLSSHYADRVWYDVKVFEQCYAEARKALSRKDDMAAKDFLQEMLALYGGDYVASFYNDWCIPRRDELRRTYINACRELALLCVRQKNYEESISHWQRLLAIDNCLEEAHYGLIHCYMCLDKRSMALRQYQHCVDILQEELATAPNASIRKLYQRLVANDESSLQYEF